MKFRSSSRAWFMATALVMPPLVLAAFAHGSAAPGSEAIDQVLRATVEHHDIPGIMAIAADRNGIVYRGAFGLAEIQENRAMTMDAIFRIYSMTKPVTSVALMQLVEQGRVSLDDPAAKYLPELANPIVFESFDSKTHTYKLRPASSAITVRELLTHTSGIGYFFLSETLRDFKPRQGEDYRVGPLLFEPGTQWAYGTSLDWIGLLVEKLSGQTLDEYFHEKIFAPLGMVDTYYNVPAEKQARIVEVYDRLPDGGFKQEPRATFSPVAKFSGSYGLYSTAADYVRFLRMLLNGGELDGAGILSKDTVALISENQIGAVRVRAPKSPLPNFSHDFTFIADNRDKWGIGFLITAD